MGEKYQCVWLSLAHPVLGTWLQPRHVLLLGIEPVTLSFIGQLLKPLSHTGQGIEYLKILDYEAKRKVIDGT